ncbi:MAG: hypothetical protein K0Q48_1346 [Bacillota bacterium]|jgi:hypothetical protein|nr:hypothetical protein [Bacillota bacterium]
MKSILMRDFFLGLMISFTLGVLAVALILGIAAGSGTMQLSLIWQVFILSAICSLVNLVYRSEQLKFLWQSLIGYVLTTGAIMGCGNIFGWYDYGGNSYNKSSFLLLSLLGYSLCYLITWMMIWRVNKRRKAAWNSSLAAYKERNRSEG